jgi:intracellular septation protein A
MSSAFLYGLVPLLIFVLIDTFAGVRTALVLAFTAALSEAWIIHAKTGEWDALSFVAAALIAVLGLITIKTNDRRYVKFQPAILSLLMAVFLAYIQLSSAPLIYRYRDLFLAMSPPQVKEYLEFPGFLEVLNFFVNWVIGLFVLNAACIAYTAVYCRTITWLLMRGIGFWVLAAVMLIVQLVYIYLWASSAAVGG